jgi:hypothetical protein
MEPNSEQPKRGPFQGKRGGRYPRGKKRYQGGYKTNQNYYQNQPYNPYFAQQNQSRYYNQYSPFMQQQLLYRTEMYICSRYNYLIDINMKNSALPEKLNENSKFFVIKSFSEEDVHKSIKYGVWSSSKNGNLTLSNAFHASHEKGGEVYLFFSCNGSGKYIGLARMKTPCDLNKSFELWTQDGKWMGLFDVEWIYIKDVPFKEFKDIKITMKDGEIKPVSNSRDTQEIPYEQGKIMVERISKYQNSNTILEHFEFYDIRQDNYEKNIKGKINFTNPNQIQNQQGNQINNQINNVNSNNNEINNNKIGANQNDIPNNEVNTNINK